MLCFAPPELTTDSRLMRIYILTYWGTKYDRNVLNLYNARYGVKL